MIYSRGKNPKTGKQFFVVVVAVTGKSNWNSNGKAPSPNYMIQMKLTKKKKNLG